MCANEGQVFASPSKALKERYLASGKYRYVDGELEKRCGRCREYWPADSEFFYASRALADGLNGNCKACYHENRYPEGRNTKTKQEVV